MKSQKLNTRPKGKAVAYTMSRFPKVTETFVLYEILEVEQAGLRVELYPLLRHHDQIIHPEADHFQKNARYMPFLSVEIIKSNLHFLVRSPLKYLSTLAQLTFKALPSPKFLAGTLAIWAKAVHFARDMQKHEVGHIHAHFATHATTAALIVNRLTGIPFSFTAHAHDIFMDTHMLDIKLSKARFAVVISEFNRNWLTERFGNDLDSKIHTIHCGVDPQVFVPRPAERKPGPLRIISVASFKDMKGHTYLLKALRMLLDRIKANSPETDFQCHLIGDGPLRNAVEKEVIDLGLEGHVIIHGALLRKEVSELTRQADMAVMACVKGARGDMDGIPVALMEAMCVGLPVVSTRLSGIPELIEDKINGFIVSPEHPKPLAEAIEALLTSKDLGRKMGAAGRDKVLREFNLIKNSQTLTELFLKSIDQGTTR